jgi:bifunctional DNase/RNase
MFERVEYLTNVTSENIPTYYFFHKKSKTLLPIKVELLSTSMVKDAHPSQPNTLDTVKKIIFAIGIKIENIKIYLYQDGYFYSHLSVISSSGEMEINCSISDALFLALSSNSPILVEKNILRDCGIKVTQKLIKESLG